MLSKLGAFLGIATTATVPASMPTSGVDREHAGTYRTPQEKKAHTKAKAKAKAAKAARKRNRR